MKEQHINDVWSTLDRESLAAISQTGPEPLFAIISGAHLYGFASPNSDVDLRGAFILPATELLGLHSAKETISVEEVRDGVELDWVAHDIRKFARMMTQHNGYVLEQLFSPLVVITTPEHKELCELGKGCITRQIFRHYRGFASGRRQKLHLDNPTVKHLLYAYRVYLTGIHALNTGEIESNILSLNERFKLEQINELVDRKKEGEEKMPLKEGEAQKHEQHLDALEQQLETAYNKSTLPVEATTLSELNDFVVRVRLKRIKSCEG